ncbi:hypothetical protein [Natronomonas gomsonensis]|uniref:hypothetical protein n=1 Tax=Natronomonas gomsonensis TaxID=1046043 RepID=UPI0020CA3FF4|nr:hypothetical protein [Natronomonas gomsonensis]
MTKQNNPSSQTKTSKDEETLQIEFVQSLEGSKNVSRAMDEEKTSLATITKNFNDVAEVFTKDRVRIIQAVMKESTISAEKLIDQLSLGNKGTADIEALDSHGIIEVSYMENEREISIPYDSIRIVGELSKA